MISFEASIESIEKFVNLVVDSTSTGNNNLCSYWTRTDVISQRHES
ncbi:hypothetical protein [Pseudobacteroides cellulosolvens]|nr:hypothetical protein [Pseudobacteroides cellulosolvens]